MTPPYNPCELDGFAFIEFSGPDLNKLKQTFKQLGFESIGTHTLNTIECYGQGHIQIILNTTPHTQAQQHAQRHGAGACAMGFYVKNAKKAHAHALQQGAIEFKDAPHAHHELLAIEAIGGSVIYFVDETMQPFQSQLKINKNKCIPSGAGLDYIDHLTHNVHRGQMDHWARFYERLFGFKEIRFFNITGQLTGLYSRALASPCGKIKIPLNESKDEHSQIEEFLQDYHGEGIQHIAFSTENIYKTIDSLREKKIQFLDTPETYYEMLNERIPWHQESLPALSTRKILMDGGKTKEEGLLLQIFTQNIFGPVFFEIIQRKGNQGFGEGNFQALFEAIERDQLRRGTLTV